MSEKLQFKVSSALKSVIGKDLIIDDFVAIFELVKNSFDASADKVSIRFDLNENEENKIFIIDDGKGMSKQDILDKWIFVAFSAKKEGEEDKVKRTYAGNKGVGRFSCDRLGTTLKLQSKNDRDEFVHCLEVDWNAFEEDSKKEFMQVDLIYTEQESFVLPDGKEKNGSGVVLEIGGLRDLSSWSRDKFIRLRRSLEKLLEPISDTEESKDITIQCHRELHNDVDEKKNADKKDREAILVNGKIENTIFKLLEGKTTVLKAKITPENKLEVELKDRGTFIYKTEEDISKVYPELSNSGFYTELSFLNRSAKSTFARRMGTNSVRYGSVFLIRNGFRVYPIGEEGNDYWGFDRRRQQGYARFLGSRDLFGFVKISGKEEKFSESSSRNQGLIQTNAAIELTACLKSCLIKLEAYVVGVTFPDKLDKDSIDFERMGLDINRYRIIQLVEKLAKSKKLTVLEFNHDLVSILNEKASEFEPSLTNLKSIASSINDEALIKQINLAEKALLKAKQAEYEAQRAADQEREARQKAEEAAKSAEAEAETATQQKEEVETAYEEEKKRNLFLTTSNSRDKDLLEDFMHQIILYASYSKQTIRNVLQYPSQIKKMKPDELIELLSELLETNQKILSTSRFATTANFRLKSSMISADLNLFLFEFLEKIATAYNTRIKIQTDIDTKKFDLEFNPIEMGMVLENLIDNAKKARSPSIKFTSTVKPNILTLVVEDCGRGLDKRITEKERIFEKGFTRTKGSGLGLSFARKRIEEIGGELKLSQVQPKRGTSFTIKVAK